LIFGYRQRRHDTKFTWLKYGSYTQKHLPKLQSLFVDLSSQFTIPVTIASLVRLHQYPPYFEVAFLHTLTTMQFISLFSITIASSSAIPEPFDWKRFWVVSLYMVVEFGCYMSIVSFFRTSKSSPETIQDLIAACKAYLPLSPAYSYVKTYQISSYVKSNIFVWIIGGLGLLIVCWGLVFGTIGLLLFFPGAFELQGLVSLAFLIGTLVCLVQMERQRNTMRAVIGAQFQDDQWGFGQVLSICLWAPLIIQSFYYLAGELERFYMS